MPSHGRDIPRVERQLPHRRLASPKRQFARHAEQSVAPVAVRADGRAVHQEADAAVAAGQEMHRNLTPRLHVVDRHKVAGAAFRRFDDVGIQQHHWRLRVRKNPHDLAVDLRAALVEERTEHDALDPRHGQFPRPAPRLADHGLRIGRLNGRDGQSIAVAGGEFLHLAADIAEKAG